MDLRLTFDEDTRNYDLFRPNYPQPLFQTIIETAGLSKSSQVVEVGIGTGQATEPILLTGSQVLAVELGGNMAAMAQAKYSKYPNFSLFQGAFEDCFLEDDSLDLLFSATAFHWIPEEIAYPKAYKALKQGGTLALFWNRPKASDENPKLVEEMHQIYEKYYPTNTEKPSQEAVQKQRFQTIANHGFVQVRKEIYHNRREFSAEDYISLLNTYSDHISLEIATKKGLEKAITELITQQRGITLDDTIDLYIAKKPPAADE